MKLIFNDKVCRVFYPRVSEDGMVNRYQYRKRMVILDGEEYEYDCIWDRQMSAFVFSDLESFEIWIKAQRKCMFHYLSHDHLFYSLQLHEFLMDD